MRNSAAVFVLVSFATLAGCGLLGKKTEDAGVDAAAAVEDPNAAADGAVAMGGTTGKNAASITRFPTTEIAVNEVKITLQASSPHTAPNGAGQLVATLKTGTSVTRVATNAGWSLVVFPDPNVPTDSLMGWVSDMAFAAPSLVRPLVDAGAVVVDAGPPPVVDAGLQCPAGRAPVIVTAPAQVCRKTCTVDKDCKGSKHCIDSHSSVTGAAVKICPNDP